MAAMRALCVAILLCSAAACAKKPAPKAPAAEPTNMERKAEPAPATAPAPGAPAPVPAKSLIGDPCSGGEKK
jgi:hypothetical protein